MKFIASSEALKKALAPLKKVINHSTVLPILEDFLVELKEGKLTFTATNLETYLSVTLDVDAKEKGSYCVPARELLQLLQAIDDQPLTFLYTPGKEARGSAPMIDPTLRIIGDDFEATLTCEDSGNYPKRPVAAGSKKATLPAEAIEALQKAVQFCSRYELRPAMTGVNLKARGKELAIAGTDACRLYWKYLPLPKGLEGIDAILPDSSVRYLLECKPGKEEVEVEINATHFFCYFGNYNLSTRLIDEKFPQYEVVIPSPESLTMFMLVRRDVKRLIRMALPFINRGTNQGKLTINSKDKQLTLEGGDVDFGLRFSSRLPASDFSSELQAVISFNLKLIQHVAHLNNDPYMSIQTSGSATKGIIIDGCIILMPLMLNE